MKKGKFVFYYGVGCRACSDFLPFVQKFCAENGKELLMCDVTDTDNPLRKLIPEIEGVPITAYISEENEVLYVLRGYTSEINLHKFLDFMH